jgi:hypothetical protein
MATSTDSLKIEICDVETFRDMFCYCGWNKQENKRYQFEISCRKNQIDAMIKHLREGDIEYIVAYNGVGFDGQVIQYILDNYDDWYDQSWKQIVTLISQCSADIIERQSYELPPIYKESKFDIKCIDPFRIHHYDNKNRRVGLKTLEFSMDLQNIQEIPIDWKKENLTEDEVQTVIDYCWNDVEALQKFWNITIGNTDNTLYKGKDMIQARLDIIEEMGFYKTAINWSDVKIGDEINKRGYMKETGCSYDDIYKKKKERKGTPPFTFGSCIPKYVKFKSETFNNLYKEIKNVKVGMGKGEQEFIVKYGETTYSIMRGGIHSHDKNRILETTDTHIIRDADIGSQYPNAINKRKLYPSHLGPKWNTNYEKTIHQRIEYKKLGKKDSKYAGLAESYKLALNGGGSTKNVAI